MWCLLGQGRGGGIFIKVTICEEVTLAITCFWVLQFNLAFVAGPASTAPKRFRRVDIFVFWFYFERYTFSSYHLHFTFISILPYTISFCAGLGQKEYSYPQERGKKETTTSDHPVNQRAATNSATSSYISYQPKSPNTPTDLPCQG